MIQRYKRNKDIKLIELKMGNQWNGLWNQWNQWRRISGITDSRLVESMMMNQWNQWWGISGINDDKSMGSMMANQWDQ